MQLCALSDGTFPHLSRHCSCLPPCQTCHFRTCVTTCRQAFALTRRLVDSIWKQDKLNIAASRAWWVWLEDPARLSSGVRAADAERMREGRPFSHGEAWTAHLRCARRARRIAEIKTSMEQPPNDRSSMPKGDRWVPRITDACVNSSSHLLVATPSSNGTLRHSGIEDGNRTDRPLTEKSAMRADNPFPPAAVSIASKTCVLHLNATRIVFMKEKRKGKKRKSPRAFFRCQRQSCRDKRWLSWPDMCVRMPVGACRAQKKRGRQQASASRTATDHRLFRTIDAHFGHDDPEDRLAPRQPAVRLDRRPFTCRAIGPLA